MEFVPVDAGAVSGGDAEGLLSSFVDVFLCLLVKVFAVLMAPQHTVLMCPDRAQASVARSMSCASTRGWCRSFSLPLGLDALLIEEVPVPALPCIVCGIVCARPCHHGVRVVYAG